MQLLFVLLENFREPFFELETSSIGGTERFEKNMLHQKSQSSLFLVHSKFIGELKN